jgi:hypothetical protein
MITDNLRERYNLPQKLSLPTFFLDCRYDEEDEEETTAFNVSFANILISAMMKDPYNPQGAIAVKPLNAKLEEEKKRLEEEKVSLEKKAKIRELNVRNQTLMSLVERLECNLLE